MFEVEFHQENHYWNRFVFKFETLEEAQQFVGSALNHFAKGDDEDDENLVINLRYAQMFSTAKEESDESNTCD